MDANPLAMATIEVSRTLIKSATELWSDLEAGRLCDFFEGAVVTESDFERRLSWEAEGVSGTVRLEASGFGTKVTVTAEASD